MNTSERILEKMVPVLYCDIDGTIRHGKDEIGHFVNEAKDVRLFDGVAALLWEYKKLGWRIVGVSNQGGIALGHMTMESCVKAMSETQVQTNYAFDKIAWCSHHPDAPTKEMAVCWCRKPKPGLVIEAALSLVEANPGEIYPPHLGLFVGDRFEDNECARNAGLEFLPAARWREGDHLRQLQENLAADRIQQELEEEKIRRDFVEGRISAHDARVALGIDPEIRVKVEPIYPVDQAHLDAALEITGVKTRTVPVKDLEPSEEFYWDGFLWQVTSKTELMLQARMDKSPERTLSFYDDTVLKERQMSPGSLPWHTEVIANAEKKFKDFHG
jgi:D-glycero-D-manno-heptose 1,7-bisphosphate phosphatase